MTAERAILKAFYYNPQTLSKKRVRAHADGGEAQIMADQTGADQTGADQTGVDNDQRDQRLAGWMGFSDVFCSSLEEIALQLDRIATLTERQAGDAFDHLESVADLTGIGRLFAGAVPADEREKLVEQHLQALLAGYVRADYLRQALQAMSGLLRGYASEANVMAAETIAGDPSLRSTALETAERLRRLHEEIGLTALRRRMLGRLGGLEINDECEDEALERR